MVNDGNVNAGHERWAPLRLPHRRRIDTLARILALALASQAVAQPVWGDPTGPDRNQIASLESTAEGQATWIRVRGTRTASFKVQRLEQPARIVVEVAEAHLAPALQRGGAGSRWEVNSWAVERVTAQSSPRGGAESVRLVVWLARPASYRVANEGRDLVVRLTARDKAPAPGDAQPVAGKPARGLNIAEQKAEKAREGREKAEKAREERAKVAKARPRPEADDADDADVDEEAPVAGSALARALAAEKHAAAVRADARRAVTKARRVRKQASQAVRRHRRGAYRLRMTARKLEADADERCARAEAAEREAMRLRAEAEQPVVPRVAAAPTAQPRTEPRAQPRPIGSLPARRSSAPPPATPAAGPTARAPAAEPARTPAAEPARIPATARAPAITPAQKPAVEPARKPAPVTTDYAAPEVAGFGQSSGPLSQQSVSQVQQRRRKVYRGRKIDLDLKDADIHNLMRLLADVGGVNIVVPDNVKASITVRMRDVPWDQALEVILASKGLWYRREGGLIRVAPRKELDAEDQAEAERLRALAESEAPETQIFTLNYSVAGKVRDQLAPLLSPKGRIEVDERTNSLIINDISAHRRRIIGLITQLDYQTPQIQIEARIVEARTSFSRDFGIQWGGSVNASAAGGNSTGLVFPNSVNVTGGADGAPTGGVVASPSDFAVNLPSGAGPGAGGAVGLSLGSVGGNVNLNLRLSAAEETGTVRIISAPRITTSNNIEASIKSGTSIPVSVISANGVQTQFVPADLLLRVTPAVSQRDCAVSMSVNVTKNEADFANTGARGDPSILTKEAKTTILVGDGQTAVIGGIYTRNSSLGYKKVPFLADIPVLGWFFKSRNELDDRSEVLVFITPKITNRAFLRCQ